MAVTVLERPQGQVLSTTGVSGLVSSTYGTGDATVGSAAHGLADGQYVYVVSNIEDYNGFSYVDVTGADTFKLLQYATATPVQYVQDSTITYYVSSLMHGWSAVHLPITYRLQSDLYPTNSLDTIRTVSSTSDSNGYTVLNVSGSLGLIHSYDYIYLTTPSDDLTGVYQIVEWVSSSVIIINLAYDSSNVFTSATAQKYYNNYNIVVRIYAGIAAGHQWESKKPYELAATFNLIPDENGQVFFSINEVLKSYIETRNNPLLGTLPNNIDFWNNFYIEYAESYDDSDGYALGTYTSSYISDLTTFEGYSVNANLEFKNVHSGYMSEYLMTGAGKFLTLFDEPVLFSDVYQDISFIKVNDYPQSLLFQYYSNGVLGAQTTTNLTGDAGVYRIPVSANCAYDRVDIILSETVPPMDPILAELGEVTYIGFAPIVYVGPPI